MSAAYSAAGRALDHAERAAREADMDHHPQAIATVAVGRMLGALAEELEALVELLRDRLAPGPCGHVVGDQCRGCDHATHRGSACLARVIAASGGVEMCRCRFDEETATQAPVVECGRPMPGAFSTRCNLPQHPDSVLHADDHGNAWT